MLGTQSWRSVINSFKQDAGTHTQLNSTTLSDAITLLGTGQVSSDARKEEVGEDLAFLAQLVSKDYNNGSEAGPPHSGVPYCRLLCSILNGPQPARVSQSAANICCSTLRNLADAPHMLHSTQKVSTLPNTVGMGTALPRTQKPSAMGTRGCVQNSSKDREGGSLARERPSQNAPPQQQEGSVGLQQQQQPQQQQLHALYTLQHEALNALACLLQSCANQVALQEQAALMALLLSTVQAYSDARTPPAAVSQSLTKPSSGLGNSTSKAAPSSGLPQRADLLESAILALQALSMWQSRPGGLGGSGIRSEGIVNAQACLIGTLQRCCIGYGRVVEDASHSRLYAMLLRVLGSLISEAKTAWVTHTGTLVECCTKLFMYGVQPAPTTSSVGAEGKGPGHSRKPCGSDGREAHESGGRYKPPHLRGSNSSNWREKGSDSGSGNGWSDSDTSDCDTGSGAIDRFKSSRVRLAVLSCLQAMAKAEPRALHAHWTTLLPVQQPLQPRPLSPHIITMLVHDPVSKVSSMAAATIACLLEGPAQRGFLAVAEARTMVAASARAAPGRGFLTLSTSLGQMVVCLHAGLIHALAVKEAAVVSLLPMVLRALCVVMSASPYDRLPQQLLPETTAALLARWCSLAETAPVPKIPGVSSWLHRQQPGSLGGVAPAAVCIVGAGETALSKATGCTETKGDVHSTHGEEVAQSAGAGSWRGPNGKLRVATAAAAHGSVGAPLHAGESLALQVAYLACLAEAFSTRQPQQGMHVYLRTLLPPSPGTDQALLQTSDQQPQTVIASLQAKHPPQSSTTQQGASAPSHLCAAKAVDASQPQPQLHGSAHAQHIVLLPPSSQPPHILTSSRQHPHQTSQEPTQQPPQGPTQQPPAPFVWQLLQACVCSHPALRIEALAALRGLATHYAFTMPGMWSELCRVVSINLDAPPALNPHISPRRANSGGFVSNPKAGMVQTNANSVASNPGAPNTHTGNNHSSNDNHSSCSGGVGAGAGAHGRGGGKAGGSHRAVGTADGTAGDASPSRNSNTPEDKAVQHAIKLLGQYLDAQSGLHGCPVSPDHQFSEGDTAPGPWRACKVGGLPDGSGWAHPQPQGTWTHASPQTAPAALATPSTPAVPARNPTNTLHPPAARTNHGTTTPLLDQHGLELTVGAHQRAVATPPTAASAAMLDATSGAARVAEFQAQALFVLVPRATSHPSLMVRAAAYSCLAGYAQDPLPCLPLSMLHSCLAMAACAACDDPAAAVRAAACKAVGNLVVCAPALADPACFSSNSHGSLHGDYSRQGVGPADGGGDGLQGGGRNGHASVEGQQCDGKSGLGLQGEVGVMDAVQHGLHDGVMSVRIASCWALANIIDALWSLYGRDSMAAAPPTHSSLVGAHGTSGQGAGSRQHGSTSSSQGEGVGASKSTLQLSLSSPGDFHPSPSSLSGEANALDQVQLSRPSLLPHQLHHLGVMCDVAVAAAHGDVDKVRANGVRAVGGLLGILGPSTALRAGLDLDVRLESLTSCLQSCITTGNAKVQWMACTAAHALFTNARLQALPRARAPTTSLLLLLTMLVRDSANFKVRTFAAAAVAALPQRALYGGMFTDALLVVCGALEGLHHSSTTPSTGSPHTSSNTTSGPSQLASSAPAMTGAGQPTPSGCAGVQDLPGRESSSGISGSLRGSGGGGEGEAAKEAGGGEGGRVFSNFRYVPGLLAQLRATLLHLMGLAQPGDGVRARDGLSRRADALLGALCVAAREAAAAVTRATGCQVSDECGSGGVVAAHSLPHDPFGGGSVGSSPGKEGGGSRGIIKGGGVQLLEAVRAAAGRVDTHVSRGKIGYDRTCEVEKQTGTGEETEELTKLDCWTVQQVARVGAAAAGFVRMCGTAQSNVKDQYIVQAEALEADAREALGVLLCESW